ncbi:MAG: citrate/2-methylcitrate synthase [Coriobacteriales bacterium]|jgi:citrate synthase
MKEEVLKEFASDFVERNRIDPKLFEEYNVKRGLRNSDGTGVLVGITKVSNVHGYVVDEGDKIPDEGKLTLRGHDIKDLIDGIVSGGRFGFVEICYLLLLGHPPNAEEREVFRQALDSERELPEGFTAEHITIATSPDIMNLLQRSVLTLYSYDKSGTPDSTSPEHELAVAISLISRLPRIMVLGYYAKRAHFYGESMIVHRFVPGQSTAETILSMLHPDRSFTHEDAVMLDIMMMLHAEHGGGNNSTFTCRSLTSSGTDPYSAYAGAIGALKGPKHGGANIKVARMFDDIKDHVSNWEDDGQIVDYLKKIVAKEAFDQSGLIYGMGHAVYTLSDPRAEICRQHARKLSQGTEYEGEFKLLESVARLAPDVIASVHGTSKVICPNIDMFSGLVYKMIGIPEDLYTPLFACSRMAGWAAHRFEELVSGGRIMRPAYKSALTEPELPLFQDGFDIGLQVP